MLMPPSPALLWILTGTAGLVAGSFSGALQTRWPAGRSVLGGRSACDGCGKQLRAWELVPLVSWLLLRGSCRKCHQPIDPAQPIAEAACGLVGIAAGALLGGYAAWCGALLGWFLVTIAMIDARHFWLPNTLTIWLALTGGAASVAGYGPPPAAALIGALAGYGALALLALAYRRLRGRDGIGGGDPKLLGAIGLWVGALALPYVLLGAALSGLLWALLIRLLGRRIAAHTRLPFGTLLALAAWPIWIWQMRNGF